MNETRVDQVRITHIGGPTVLIEIGWFRIVSDPTFDLAGSQYASGPNILHKLSNPALTPEEIGEVDAVLLSHDHHKDNLDLAGRAYLSQARAVLTTPVGAERLGGGARGVKTWETVELKGGDGLVVRVTATPARHGPEEIRPVVGDVTGWILEWDGQRRGALYISGDTVLFDELEEVARRYRVSIALLHLGRASVQSYGPGVYLTFTGVEGAELAGMLGEAIIMPIHYEGWAHFSEGRAEIERAFADAGLTQRLRFLPLGQAVTLDA